MSDGGELDRIHRCRKRQPAKKRMVRKVIEIRRDNEIGEQLQTRGLVTGARRRSSYFLEDRLVVIHVVHSHDDLSRGRQGLRST